MGQQYTECVGDAENSRNSLKAAGWEPPPEGSDPTKHWADRLECRQHPKWDSFSWLTVRALYESINDVFAKAGPTIVRGRRARWVAAQRAAGVEVPRPGGPGSGHGNFAPDFVVDRKALTKPRFILLGDPGEADASQYAVIDPLLSVHRERKTDFMVIVSDVIYPAGDVNEYVNAFYLPYGEYDRPIYALPGNHDWYDGLNGFMFHFCAAEPLPPVRYRRGTYGPGEQAALSMWRGAARPDRDLLTPWINERARRARSPAVPPDASSPAPGRHPVQPAPYFAIDTGPLLLVSIDTGVAGELDAEQGEWLRRVSRVKKDKILLTGKPIYVNNEYHPCPIVWREEGSEPTSAPPRTEPLPETADDIVRDADHRYVAVIGGDVHNYQRYPVRLRDGRTIQYIVSGGGGAYLSATHSIEKVGPTCKQGLPPDVEGFDESEFRCYPLRGDSLTLYTRSAGPLLFKLMLSAPVLVLATFAMMFLVLGELDSRRLPILLGSGLGAVLVGAAAVGFVMRDKFIAATTAGYRALLLGTLSGLVALGATVAMLQYGDAEANSAAGIAIGFPFAVVAAMVLAYTLRGSRPEYAPALLILVPLIALFEICRPGDFDGAWALVLYAMVPLLFLLVGVWAVERARQGLELQTFLTGQRIAVVAAWGVLAFKVLWDQASPEFLASTDWLSWTIVVLVATALLVGRAVPHLTPHPHRPNQSDRSAWRDIATGMVGLTLIVLVLHALAQLGDGWPGKVTALAFSTFVGAVGMLLFLVVGFLIHWSPCTLLRMRTGRADPGLVAEYVAGHVGGGVQPVRAVATSGADKKTRGMVRAIRRLGKVVSEIAESNEPPFYKSFLLVEAESDALVVRCYGVTGYTPIPTLEDCVSIPLRSEADE